MLRRFRIRRCRYHVVKARKYFKKGLMRLVIILTEHKNIMKNILKYQYKFVLSKNFYKTTYFNFCKKLLLEKNRTFTNNNICI